MTHKNIIKESRNEHDVTIIALQGSLDVSVQKDLREGLDRLSQAQGDLVLDCSQVSFIDSSCLGILVAVAKNLREKKGDIKLALLNDDVRSIFQITRLDRIFTLFDSVAEAVESYYK